MNLSPIYLERLAEAKQKGRNEGLQEGVKNERRTVIENLLRARFGSLDDDLNSIIQPLSSLTSEESAPLLLQLSREELISRFRK